MRKTSAMNLPLYFDQPSGLFEVASFQDKLPVEDLEALERRVHIDNAYLAIALGIEADILNNDKEVTQ